MSNSVIHAQLASREQIQISSMARGERLAKYNELLRIEEELGPAAFAGWQAVAVL